GGGRSSEADVKTRLLICGNWALGGNNPKRYPISAIPVADPHPRGAYTPVSEWLQHRVVEVPASFNIPYPYRDVCNHAQSLRIRADRVLSPVDRLKEIPINAQNPAASVKCSSGDNSPLPMLYRSIIPKRLDR